MKKRLSDSELDNELSWMWAAHRGSRNPDDDSIGGRFDAAVAHATRRPIATEDDDSEVPVDLELARRRRSTSSASVTTPSLALRLTLAAAAVLVVVVVGIMASRNDDSDVQQVAVEIPDIPRDDLPETPEVGVANSCELLENTLSAIGLQGGESGSWTLVRKTEPCQYTLRGFEGYTFTANTAEAGICHGPELEGKTTISPVNPGWQEYTVERSEGSSKVRAAVFVCDSLDAVEFRAFEDGIPALPAGSVLRRLRTLAYVAADIKLS